MATSVNWLTGIISIPKADLTLIQSSPTEIRQLDINAFRLELRDLEENEDGRPFPRTHDHNAPVDIGGVSLARVIQILSPYTITFEDGQYAVNLTNANSNIGDRVNVNQVSVRSANSAGLQELSALRYASFGGVVSVDLASSNVGTIYPVGNMEYPSNNFNDAVDIANTQGFAILDIRGDADIVSEDILDEFILKGQNPALTKLNIAANASVDDCSYMDATITGTLDGDSTIHDCRIDGINYMSGDIHGSELTAEIITLGSGSQAMFAECWSGVPGSNTPIIDCGGSGQKLALRGYVGGIRIKNRTGTDDMSIDLESGHIIIDATCTGDPIILRGIFKLTVEVGATAPITEGRNIVEQNIDALWYYDRDA